MRVGIYDQPVADPPLRNPEGSHGPPALVKLRPIRKAYRATPKLRPSTQCQQLRPQARCPNLATWFIEGDPKVTQICDECASNRCWIVVSTGRTGQSPVDIDLERSLVRRAPEARDVRPEPGLIVEVRIDGRTYDTIIDREGIQRFRANGVVALLKSQGRVDLNQLAREFQRGVLDVRSYAEFYMALGYGLVAFSELDFFRGLKVENPLWEE